MQFIQADSENLLPRKQDLTVNDFDLKHLNDEQKQKLSELHLNNFAACSKSVKTLGCTDRIQPKITLRNHNPIKALPLTIPQSLLDNVITELDELVEAGIINRTISEWACPMLLVKKKSDPNVQNDIPKFRLAMDLRLLNSIIEPSSYPLPKISTLLNDISSYKFYTLLI